MPKYITKYNVKINGKLYKPGQEIELSKEEAEKLAGSVITLAQHQAGKEKAQESDQLKAENAELKKQVSSLKGEITKLKKKVDEQEKEIAARDKEIAGLKNGGKT